MRLRWAALALSALTAVGIATPLRADTVLAAALQLSCPAPSASDPLAVPSGLIVPSPTPVAADPVRAVALQHLQQITDVVDVTSFRAKLDCELAALVLPQLRAGHANLVSLNELTGLIVFALGERGAAARQIAGTPAGRGSADTGGVPAGAAAGLLAAGAAYGPALAYYHLPPAGSAAFSVHDLFVAATDTFVRGFVMTLRDAAAKYSALAAGPVYLAGSAPMPAHWHVELPSSPTFTVDCLALYANPSQCATAPPDRLYIADESNAYNLGMVVGPHPVDPDHPLLGTTAKVNLTALEGPSLLDLTPGSLAQVQPIALPGTAARLGIAISLDAFEAVAPCDPTRTATYIACLDARGANVVVQLEANDAVTPSGSWADYIDTGADVQAAGANPQWQPMTWMLSAWRTVSDPALHFRYAINSFLVGNLLDIAFDGQSTILRRGGTACGDYVGDGRFLGPYPSGGPDEAPYARLLGAKPEFLALADWAIPDADRATLVARSRAMAPGSGSPLEDAYRETAVAADMTLTGAVPATGQCAGPAAATAAGPGNDHPTGLVNTGTATPAPAGVAVIAVAAGWGWSRRRRRRLSTTSGRRGQPHPHGGAGDDHAR